MGDEPPDRYSAKVHQATGMIAAQLHCDPAEALARMRIRADALCYSLDTMADLVLDLSIRFDQ